MIKQLLPSGHRTSIHADALRDECTCKYCCSVRDFYDDQEIQLEYEVALSCGKDIFNELQVGDQVEYYIIPHEHRKMVYLPANIKWELIQEEAKKFNATVTSKTQQDVEIETNGHKRKISAAECWEWALRKN